MPTDHSDQLLAIMINASCSLHFMSLGTTSPRYIMQHLRFSMCGHAQPVRECKHTLRACTNMQSNIGSNQESLENIFKYPTQADVNNSRSSINFPRGTNTKCSWFGDRARALRTCLTKSEGYKAQHNERRRWCMHSGGKLTRVPRFLCFFISPPAVAKISFSAPSDRSAL